MEELIASLLAHLRGMWRYRWWGVAAAWLAGVILAVTVFLLPDQFEASARVYVDTQSVLKPLMQGLAVPSNVEQQITILSRTLISRPNVEKLIQMADLDLKVKTREEKEALIDELMHRLQIASGGRSDLFTLSFKDTNPERAKRVVQALVSIFVESGLGDKRKDNDDARRFIDEQIKNYEQKLVQAENRLKEFKLKNMAMFGDSGKDSVTHAGDLSAQLNQARLELREMENSRDALRRQLAGEDPAFLPESEKSNSGVSVPELDGRIDAMKKQLDSLQQRYTDQHPDVVQTKRIIEQLEQQKHHEVDLRRKSGGVFDALGTNPVYQQLKLSLSESEANIASLKTRVAEYEARVNSMRGAARLMPEIDAQYAQLNRDYEVNKRNYEGLITRRESANLSVEMDASAGMADFRLIDPPSVPSKPAAPNRALLMPLAGLVSLVFGVLFSFLLSQALPVFFDGSGLRMESGLPVLGTITMIKTDSWEKRIRRGNLLFVAAVSSLVLFFGGLTAELVLRAFAS